MDSSICWFESQVDLMEPCSDIWLCTDRPRDVVPTRETDHGEIPAHVNTKMWKQIHTWTHVEMNDCKNPSGCYAN
jgi:hypothetical protein